MSKRLATSFVLLAVAFRECPGPAIKMPLDPRRPGMPGGDRGAAEAIARLPAACVMNGGFRQMAVAPGPPIFGLACHRLPLNRQGRTTVIAATYVFQDSPGRRRLG